MKLNDLLNLPKILFIIMENVIIFREIHFQLNFQFSSIFIKYENVLIFAKTD